MRRSIRSAVLACASLVVAGAAAAAPVNFNVTSSSFTPGSGYGVDASEVGNATLLDVLFTANNAQQSFTLASPGDSAIFSFGTILFRETGVIGPNETDNLGVSATFTFTDPLSGLRSVTATGTATIGVIPDADIDYTISWNPVTVAFGNGGLFSIQLESENFRLSGQSHDEMVRIQLLTAPAAVPEPASLALAGAALAALGFSRRRRAAR